MKISKTTRILAVFHLFLHCQEVCYKEFDDFFGEKTCRKTDYRDICFLKQAGLIRARYSGSLRAYIPEKGEERFVPKPFDPPKLPESKAQRNFMEKIIRLAALMTEMWGETDPIGWYSEHYPELGARTRQRDFAELHKISYEMFYVHADETEDGVGHYNCRIPTDAYDFYFNE